MTGQPWTAETARLDSLFQQQRDAFAANPCPTLKERRASLKRLRGAIKRHADALSRAARADFGCRSDSETLMLDVLPSLLHVDHLSRHLAKWMRPSSRGVEWLFLGNRASVRPQPKGVVGVLAPWNFPVYLALGPLATALAAGNRCLIKTSEYAPNTSAALKALLADCLPEDQAAVVEGDAALAHAFASLPFDHIVFTGSTAVGKLVMAAAAPNLTPVTLELGGKSPAIVSRTADLAVAARRVAHGKVTNAGQICVAPDYALVPEEFAVAFAREVTAAAARLSPPASARSPHGPTSLIHDRAYQRQLELIADARAKGAHVLVCASPDDGRRLPLHVVLGVTDDMRLAQEEIFGPILPIRTYARFEDALARVRAGDRPLALYYFGRDKAEREALLDGTHSGGVTFNDWGWHVVNHELPFGGVGASGMGSYHGEEGFRELSHARAVFDEHRLFPIELFHPPYGGALQRLLLKLVVGTSGARR